MHSFTLIHFLIIQFELAQWAFRVTVMYLPVGSLLHFVVYVAPNGYSTALLFESALEMRLQGLHLGSSPPEMCIDKALHFL